jgi:hypothetical protein
VFVYWYSVRILSAALAKFSIPPSIDSERLYIEMSRGDEAKTPAKTIEMSRSSADTSERIE